MNPIVKKAVAALAVKEVIDRIQEARRPQRSFASRHKGKALWALLIGGGIYLFKTGKAQPLLEQVKGLRGQSDSDPGAYPGGPLVESRGPGSEAPSTPETSSNRPLEPSHG